MDKRDKMIEVIMALFLLLGGISIFAIFAGVLMSIFGLQYESMKSFILYFVIAAILQYILNIVLGILYGIVVNRLGLSDGLNQTSWKWSLVCLDIASSIFSFTLVDHCMQSVSATPISILIVSVISGLYDRKKDR